jgi:hypothetical protein
LQTIPDKKHFESDTVRATGECVVLSALPLGQALLPGAMRLNFTADVGAFGSLPGTCFHPNTFFNFYCCDYTLIRQLHQPFCATKKGTKKKWPKASRPGPFFRPLLKFGGLYERIILEVILLYTSRLSVPEC